MKSKKKSIYADHLACYLFASRLINARRVLELGCGDGYGAQMMSLFASEYIGYDFSPQHLANAKSKQMYCPWWLYKKDLEKDPLDLSSSDMVVAFEVLEHIDNPESILKQIVDEGKEFIFSVPHNDAHPWHKRVYRSLEDVENILPLDAEVKWYSLRAGSIIEGFVRDPKRYIGVSRDLVI